MKAVVMPTAHDPMAGYLLVAPNSCRHSPQWDVIEPDSEQFREKYLNEFGYTPPRPTHLASSMDSSRRIDLDGLADSNLLVSACREAIEPHVLRCYGNLPGTSPARERFFDLVSCGMTVANDCPLDPHDAALREYWTAWQRRGEGKGEWRLEVGLASSQLIVLTAARQVHMLWWERETQVAERAEVEEAFARICALLEPLDYADLPQLLARLARCWLDWSFERFARVVAQAHDHGLSLYQNPMWESLWSRLGRDDVSQDIRSRNLHPDTGQWLRHDSLYVVPDPYGFDA